MPLTLFIAEKPSLGRSVAKALGVVKDCKTHVMCKNDCVVAFAQGHLYEMLKPEEYNDKFKVWRREDLPLQIGEMKLKPAESTKYRLDVIRDFLKQADQVVHVGDPDREGQRIVDDILEQLHYKGPVKRLWNTDQSERGMKKTMEDFSKGFPDNSEPVYYNRSLAARARAEMDWRLGMNISRAVGCRLNMAGIRKTVSYGRFQTTVLAIIVARELERRAFKPKTFYTPKALISGIETEFVHNPEAFPEGYDIEGYLVDKGTAEKIKSLANGKDGVVAVFERKTGAKQPPLPYDITRLIQDVNRLYGISAKETNDIAQSLYDKGITTYPRVDCRYLPEAHHADAARILGSLKGLPGADTANPKLKGRCFNTKKTDEAAHHAIVPTGDAWAKLTGKELKIFELVAKAYIFQFHPDQEFETQKLVVEFDGPPKTSWKATGKKILKPGWSAIGSDSDDEDSGQELPDFTKGQIVHCDSAFISEGETKKPSSFTEASIINAMENIDRFEPNPEYRKLLKDAKGIGTGATRGGILDLLQKREYIEIKKGVITPTEYGEDLVSWIPQELKSPALTAIMEGELEDIAQGRLAYEKMMEEVEASIPEYLEAVDKVKITPPKGSMCPVCKSGAVVRLMSKNSGKYFWKCQNPECGKFFNDNKGKIVTPQKCPACGEIGLSRRESSKKKGVFFWSCSECRKFFADNDGKVGSQFVDAADRQTAECPVCGKTATRYESRQKPGTWFWKCPDCGFFEDDNGKIGKKSGGASAPADAPRDRCPVCGESCVQLTSKKGTVYWKCEKAGHGPFFDDNGKPGAAFGSGGTGSGAKSSAKKEKCPHCGKVSAVRRESKNKAGSFFWACDNCGLMSDDNGKPGKVFKPKEQ